jgi:hypothetical protein
MYAELQTLCAERLNTDSRFSGAKGVTVLTEQKGDLEAQIKKALGSIGLGVCLLTPDIRIESAPTEAVVTLLVGITENYLNNQGSNGTKIAALTWCEYVQGLLLDWSPDEIWTPIQGGQIELQQATQPLVYAVHFTTRTLIRLTT